MADLPSEMFHRFVASVHAPLTAANREQYDLDALAAMTADEKAAVVELLVERLNVGDGRAASSLAAIGSPAATGALVRSLATPVPALVRVECARALARLGDPRAETPLVDVLRGADAHARKYAANALQLVHTKTAEQALVDALEDADAGVRGNAFGALVVARGLKAFDGSYRDPIGLTYPLLGSPIAAVRAIAVARVRVLLKRLDAGEAPTQLGLSPIDDSHGPTERWMASLRSQDPPWAEDLALDALDAMGERERGWAEDVLLGYLHLDPRAARAAAHSGDARFVEPLREVMTRYVGAVQVEAAAAVDRLIGDDTARALLAKVAAGSDSALAARARQVLGS